MATITYVLTTNWLAVSSGETNVLIQKLGSETTPIHVHVGDTAPDSDSENYIELSDKDWLSFDYLGDDDIVYVRSGAATSNFRTTKVVVVTGTSGAFGGPLEMVGDVPAGSTDSGNPVKVGGEINTTPPSYGDGERGSLQLGARGSLKTELSVPGTANTVSHPQGNDDSMSQNQYGLLTSSRVSARDGSGAFVHIRGTVANGLNVDVTRLPVAAQEALLNIANNTSLFHPVDGETVAISSTHNNSNALPAGRVWIKSMDCDFHISINDNPTATTSTSPPHTKGQDYYYNVEAGDVISVIEAAGESGGTLYISTESEIN